jgi:hypothetical protein
MKQKIIFLTVFIVAVFSCQKNKIQYKQYECKVDFKVEILPDSSFFSNIMCMQYQQGYIYFLDVKRGDIVAINETFDDMYTISSAGQGPKELSVPGSFCVLQDSAYIYDDGYRGIKNFIKGAFVGINHINEGTNKRFFCTSDYFYISGATDSHIFAKINKKEPLDTFMEEKLQNSVPL